MSSFKVVLLGIIIVSSQITLAADPQWIEVRSPNFSVITDAGDKRGRDVALHFEQMRSVFGTLMTRANVNLSVPLQIVAFRNTKEMYDDLTMEIACGLHNFRVECRHAKTANSYSR